MKILDWVLGKKSTKKSNSVESSALSDHNVCASVAGRAGHFDLSMNLSVENSAVKINSSHEELEKNNKYVFHANEVHCQKIRPSQKPTIYIVTVVIDGEQYEIKARYSDEEYASFMRDRLQKRFYTQIPNSNQVALPVRWESVVCDFNTDNWFYESAAKEYKGYKFFLVDKRKFLEWYKAKEKTDEKERLLAKVVELNNRGKQEEKNGLIEKAIETYEECISVGHPTLFPFERLIILYHRAKQYEEEKRVICLQLKTYGDNEKLLMRLQKLEQKIGNC